MTKENNLMTASVTAITVYEVKGDSDCEGRLPQYLVGYFLNRASAEHAAQGKGGMGTFGYVSPVPATKLTFSDGSEQFFLSPIKVKSISDEELKKKALDKAKATLSAEELRVLGIKG